MANNDLLYNAAIEGICAGASRASTDVTGTIYTNIDIIAVRLAVLIDAAIPPIVGGASTSQAGLLKGICEGVYRYVWPSSTTMDLTQQVDAIVTQFVAQQSLLLPVSGLTPGVIPLNPHEYWINNNADPVGADGTIAHPFISWAQAIAALSALAPAAVSAVFWLAPSSTGYYGSDAAIWGGALTVHGDGDRANVNIRGINLPNATVCVRNCTLRDSDEPIIAGLLRLYDCVNLEVDITVNDQLWLLSTVSPAGVTYTAISGTGTVYVDHTSNYWVLTNLTTLVGCSLLLMAIGGAGGGRNATPYVTFVDMYSVSVATPDGSYENPFLTVASAVAATEALPDLVAGTRVFMIAPGTYNEENIALTPEKGRYVTFHGWGSKDSLTVAQDWTLYMSTATDEESIVTFQDMTLTSTGGGEDDPFWEQTCSNASFIRCKIDLNSGGQLKPFGVVDQGVNCTFEECTVISWPQVWSWNGVPSSTPHRLELDGISRCAPPLPTFTVADPTLTVTNAIPRNPCQYWVNNNEPSMFGEQWTAGNGAPTIVSQGTVAHPFLTLQEAIDRIEELGETRACIHLAASDTNYTATSATIGLVYLSIRGEGELSNGAAIDGLNLPACAVECHNIFFHTAALNVFSLRTLHCWLSNVDVTVGTGFEMNLTKIDGVSPPTYTSTTPGTIDVDFFTNAFFIAVTPTLVTATKSVIGDVTP